MNFREYWNDKKLYLLVVFSGALFFTALLWLFGIGAGELLLLWICFACITAGLTVSEYTRRRRRFRYLQSVADALDQKYLLAEIADKPQSETERFYFGMLQTALKAMTDEVAASRRLNDEYRDFVEQWIHEMKVPVTGIQLLCENNKSDVMRKVLTQTELISQSVERVLFYARLGSAEKDYLITEVSLKACALEVLAQNRQFLIQNHVCVQTEALTDTVHSDQKWLQFILNQILINSVKYRGSLPPVVEMASQDHGDYVTMSVTDNGIGILESEIGRVFDKGFVGSNGRAGKNATGIGLYLCSRLCGKLGIDMEIRSQAGAYTTVLLHFPKESHLTILLDKIK